METNRQLAELADQSRQAAEVSSRAERTEAVRAARAANEAMVKKLNSKIAGVHARLATIVQRTAHATPHTIDHFRNNTPNPTPPSIDTVSIGPKPTWDEYRPKEPGIFGRRRWERETVAARAAYENAQRMWVSLREKRHSEILSDFSARLARDRAVHTANWTRIAESVAGLDAKDICELVGQIISTADTVTDCIEGGEATYDPEAKELVLQIFLSDPEIVPEVREWNYAVGKREINCRNFSERQRHDIYNKAISHLSLAIIDFTFRSTPEEVVDAISFNGHVQTIDRTTGKPATPCVITISTNRQDFQDLNLTYEELDTQGCLKRLGAETSPNPYVFVHIEPIVDFELSKYRIAYGPEALAAIDHRVDLLQMNPFEFERLVRELFAKMGYDTWTTQARRDDGIDAVATKSDPYMPVECIIQAKRFKGAVAPKEVQALMGAMAEKPSATHGYLVTTSWLSPRTRQRARELRIHTIERNELATLIESLLGKRVLISNQLPRGYEKQRASDSAP